MPARRRRYSAEERERAVRAASEGSRPAAAVARELGINPGTLRRWLRIASGSEWADRVERHFGFLTRYGFARTDVDTSNWWAVRVTYRSRRSALAVIRSYEFDRVEVELMRLVDGELPGHPVFVVDSVPVHRFLADDLLVLRRPDADEVLARQRGVSDREIEAQLAFWSKALREHGQDFLAGDLGVLDELERIVRDRVRQHRREVTVWLPDDASASDEARAVTQAQRGVPDGVSVVARRYLRPGRRAPNR